MAIVTQPEQWLPQARVPLDRMVLVLDEDPNLRALIETLLRRAGYQVLAAADAETAQRLLPRWSVDLLIMELSLPGMDGLTFLVSLKRDPATRALPVLIVSARSGRQLRDVCAALGVAGYLTKPFRGRELVAAVDQILGTAERS